MSKETEGESLNFEGVQDDLDDSISISHAPKKCPTTSNSSSRKRRRTEDSEESGESFKELTTLFVTEMKETSIRLTRTLGQEINDKQVGLSDELNKIASLTMVERLRATTLISRNNAVLNVFL